MNKTLTDFETAVNLNAPEAAMFLGVAYSTYAQCRNGHRPLKRYHQYSVEAALRLPPAELAQLKQERLHDREETRRRIRRSQPRADI